MFAFTATPVSAATAKPGCYLDNNRIITEATCPSENFKQQAETNAKCYVTEILNKAERTVSSFVEKPCSSFETGQLRSKCNATDENGNSDLTVDCPITNYIAVVTKALSGLVGIVVVAMIVFGGIQYSAARSDPQASAAAKKRITGAIIALLIYVFSFAAIQYLVPGGVL